MANLTRVNQMALANALGGDTQVADAIGNALNGSAMNGFTPDCVGGSASGVWAQIGTLIYVEIIATGAVKSVTLPFTHQGLSNTWAVMHGCSDAGISINGMCAPLSTVLTLHKYDGSSLPAGTYRIGGTYESDVG